MKTHLQKGLSKNVHSCFICNSPKLKASTMFINRKINDKQCMVHSCIEMVLNDKNEILLYITTQTDLKALIMGEKN